MRRRRGGGGLLLLFVVVAVAMGSCNGSHHSASAPGYSSERSLIAQAEAAGRQWQRQHRRDLRTTRRLHRRHRAAQLPAVASGARCALGRVADRRCTPGRAVRGHTAGRCRHYNQSYREVTDAVKARVARAYGLPRRRWHRYEFDHLIPRYACGADTRANLWPERNYAHPQPFLYNPKDRQENGGGRWSWQALYGGSTSVRAVQRHFVRRWSR